MRKALVAIVTVLVIAVAGACWWAFKPASSPQTQSTQVQSQALPISDVQRLESALNSTDPNVQASAMAAETKSAYLANGQQVRSGGLKFRFRAETFVASGNSGKIDADAVTADSQTKVYQVILTRQDATQPWLVLTTEGK